jgi:putative transcriptional regulator
MSVVVETLQAPYLLLASPALEDPNFHHAVVLMGHHNEEGAVGWIVNRVVDGGAASLLPEPLAKELHPETPLRIGGPVFTPGLLVVHRSVIEGVESTELAPGLLVCARAEVLPRLFTDPPYGRPMGLLVFGYSGWGPGQLEDEMEKGAWLVLPYDEEIAFPADAQTLWERALLRLGLTPGSVASPPGGVN